MIDPTTAGLVNPSDWRRVFRDAAQSQPKAVQLACAKHLCPLQEQTVMDLEEQTRLVDFYCPQCEAAIASLIQEVADAPEAEAVHS